MKLCVNVFWPFKIICSLILMQIVFNVWVLGTKRLKILFLEDLGWIQVFFKKLLISYSCISFMKHCALRSFCINCSIFQKFEFSRFSIDWSCCLTDRDCDKKFGLNMLGSIGARLIEIWTMSVLKRVFSRVLHYFQNFWNTLFTNLSRVFVLKHF